MRLQRSKHSMMEEIRISQCMSRCKRLGGGLFELFRSFFMYHH